MEHRWSMRCFPGCDVTVSHPQHGLLRATVRDISLGGMFIQVDRVSFPLNAPVAVSFTLLDGAEKSHHRLHAMVVRTTVEGAALMYLDSSAETIRPLRQTLYGQAGRLLFGADTLAPTDMPPGPSPQVH